MGTGDICDADLQPGALGHLADREQRAVVHALILRSPATGDSSPLRGEHATGYVLPIFSVVSSTSTTVVNANIPWPITTASGKWRSGGTRNSRSRSSAWPSWAATAAPPGPTAAAAATCAGRA